MQLRRAVVIALAVTFIGVGWSTVFRAGLGQRERSDFPVYHAAGVAVMKGTPLYQAKSAAGFLYMYLPVFAVLMVPLALLPKVAAAGAWYLFSLAMLLDMIRTSVRLAEARAGPSRIGPFWVGVFALALTGWPWMSGLTRGQASVMLSWLTIVSIDLFLRGGARHRWGGAFALALATAIRIFPVLMGLWLLLQRQWQALGACVAAGIVLVFVAPALVFGPRGNLVLVDEWATTIALPTGDAAAIETNVRYGQMMNPRIDKNQSLQGVMIRWLAPWQVGTLLERDIRRAATGVGAALLFLTVAACLTAVRRHADDPELPLLQASALLVLTLVLPPVSWTHNYSLMVLPLSLMLVRATRRDGSMTARLAVALWLLLALAAFLPGGSRADRQLGEEIGVFLFGGLAVWAILMITLLRFPIVRRWTTSPASP